MAVFARLSACAASANSSAARASARRRLLVRRFKYFAATCTITVKLSRTLSDAIGLTVCPAAHHTVARSGGQFAAPERPAIPANQGQKMLNTQFEPSLYVLALLIVGPALSALVVGLCGAWLVDCLRRTST